MNTSITISGEGSYGYMHVDSPELGTLEPQAIIIGAASEIRKEVLEELSVAGIIVSMDEVSINIKNMSPID